MQPHRDPFQAMSHADLQQILFDFFSPHIREREKMKSLMACRAHSTILTNIFGHYAIHGDSLSRLTSPSCEQWRKLSTSVDSLVILWTEWELLSDQPHRLFMLCWSNSPDQRRYRLLLHRIGFVNRLLEPDSDWPPSAKAPIKGVASHPGATWLFILCSDFDPIVGVIRIQLLLRHGGTWELHP